MSDLRARMPAQGLMVKATGSSGAAETSESRSSWYTGALGEYRVAGVLASFGPEWTVLHSVPVGNAECDIDHVLIGPPGVFTINSKHHAAASIWSGGWGLFVNGSKTGYIPKAVAEAQRAEKLLSEAAGLTVPVVAVIAFVGADSFSGEAPPAEGVQVMPHTDLVTLSDHRREFSNAQVQRITAAAARSSTWRSKPLAPADDRDRLIVFLAKMAADASVHNRAVNAAATAATVNQTAPSLPDRASGRRAKMAATASAVAPAIVAPHSRPRISSATPSIGRRVGGALFALSLRLVGGALIAGGIYWAVTQVLLPVALAQLTP